MSSTQGSSMDEDDATGEPRARNVGDGDAAAHDPSAPLSRKRATAGRDGVINYSEKRFKAPSGTKKAAAAEAQAAAAAQRPRHGRWTCRLRAWPIPS